MTEIELLVKTLKRRLKLQGLTYRDLAERLKVSEPSIKRLFASRRFTLERLVDIANLLGFTLAELAQEAAISEGRVQVLSEIQERELVADEKLLLVAVCVLNQWAVGDITQRYALSEAEVVQRLARLDRLRLIQLLPMNRIRLNVARDFDWQPNGPIRRYFIAHGLDDFLAGSFSDNDEVLAFSHGMLTEVAIVRMQAEIRKLRQKFAECHAESLLAPLEQRRGCGLIVAMREWELAGFTVLRRLENTA